MTEATCPYCGMKFPGQYTRDMHSQGVHRNTPEGAAMAQERTRYETKAALSVVEQSWRALIFSGKSVRVTSADIRVEGHSAISLQSVVGCELRPSGWLMNPHVRLEYLGDDGAKHLMRFYPVRVTFVQSPHDFASDLYEAINSALRDHKEGISAGGHAGQESHAPYVPERKTHTVLIVVGLAIGITVGLGVIGGPTGFVIGISVGGVIVIALRSVVRPGGDE